jgi:hypothetical protein
MVEMPRWQVNTMEYACFLSSLVQNRKCRRAASNGCRRSLEDPTTGGGRFRHLHSSIRADDEIRRLKIYINVP